MTPEYKVHALTHPIHIYVYMMTVVSLVTPVLKVHYNRIITNFSHLIGYLTDPLFYPRDGCIYMI